MAQFSVRWSLANYLISLYGITFLTQDLNVKIDHVESFVDKSPDSNAVYSIYVECDFRDEETKAELAARLKACTGTLDDIKFLSISEACEGIAYNIMHIVWLNH